MEGPFKPYDARAVIPQDFLYSKYQPLNDWLDTPVQIQIMEKRLLDVLNEPALRGLAIRVVRAPRLNPVITMKHLAMTRRQLLWTLAQDYQLDMTLIFLEYDQGGYIEVRARQ